MRCGQYIDALGVIHLIFSCENQKILQEKSQKTTKKEQDESGQDFSWRRNAGRYCTALRASSSPAVCVRRRWPLFALVGVCRRLRPGDTLHVLWKTSGAEEFFWTGIVRDKPGRTTATVQYEGQAGLWPFPPSDPSFVFVLSPRSRGFNIVSRCTLLLAKEFARASCSTSSPSSPFVV